MEKSLPILHYRTPNPSSPSLTPRRFLTTYASGVLTIYATLWYCISSWPHTTNNADPRKAELSITVQVAGGTACAWLILALRRLPSEARSGFPYTLLVGSILAANALAALAVLQGTY
jgi:hypothetical protein